MKKISLILLMICFLFSFPLKTLNAKDIEHVEIDNLEVTISGSSKTKVELSFTTKEELENLEIWIYSNLNDGTGELVYAYNKYNDPDYVKYTLTQSNDPEKPWFNYEFEFNLNSGKIGTFEVILKYNLYEEGFSDRYSQSIFVTSGNADFDLDLFSTTNAILIGVIATVFSAIGTIILIKYSEKNAQLGDDEE